MIIDFLSGEKVPAVLHGKQIMKQSPSTDVLSPRCNTSTCSRSVSAAPYLYKTSGLRKRQADNTLGTLALITVKVLFNFFAA